MSKHPKNRKNTNQHNRTERAHQKRDIRKARRLTRGSGHSLHATLVGVGMVVAHFLGGLDVSVTIPQIEVGGVTVGPIVISNTNDD